MLPLVPQVSFLTQSLMGAPKPEGRQAPGSTGGSLALASRAKGRERSGRQAGQAWAGCGRQREQGNNPSLVQPSGSSAGWPSRTGAAGDKCERPRVTRAGQAGPVPFDSPSSPPPETQTGAPPSHPGPGLPWCLRRGPPFTSLRDPPVGTTKTEHSRLKIQWCQTVSGVGALRRLLPLPTPSPLECKAELPISVTPSGIITSKRSGQPKKAKGPITFLILSGMF